MIVRDVHDLHFTPAKIVSLVPSQTELLYHLGLDEKVTGITKFCIHPASWKKSKHIVGGTKHINIQKIKQLQPDLIIANKEENVKEEIELLAKDFNIWVTDVATLDDSVNMIHDLSLITKTEAAGLSIIQQIRANFNQLQPLAKKLNTCYLIWQDPYMTVGADTFINDMMKRCGFNNIFLHKKRYPQTSINFLKAQNCELLLLASEPFPFKQKHITDLQKDLPAAKILLVDGEMFSWYGSRLINAPAYLGLLINQLR